jgi:hypothetical protein
LSCHSPRLAPTEAAAGLGRFAGELDGPEQCGGLVLGLLELALGHRARDDARAAVDVMRSSRRTADRIVIAVSRLPS